MARMDDVHVPSWAATARGIFRALIIVYSLLWLVRIVIALIDLTFDTGIGGNLPGWLNVFMIVFAAVWAASGVVWLAGASVTGYTEPKRKD